MSSEKLQNLQDTFLNHIRKNKVPVTVFLVNGVKLQGIITWFDNFCVLLRRDGHSQLVYKHAISTVMPVAPEVSHSIVWHASTIGSVPRSITRMAGGSVPSGFGTTNAPGANLTNVKGGSIVRE